jgi:hypothetical protein
MNKMSKIMLNYRPNGRRQLGRPVKSLVDKVKTSIFRPNLDDDDLHHHHHCKEILRALKSYQYFNLVPPSICHCKLEWINISITSWFDCTSSDNKISQTYRLRVKMVSWIQTPSAHHTRTLHCIIQWLYNMVIISTGFLYK